jgi:hypothetical protein
MSNYDLIRDAIEQKLHVIAEYNGHRREMCPHVLGRNKDGDQQALFYQFGGTSETDLEPDGSSENWRCIRVRQLRNVVTQPGPWHTATARRRSQSCVARVHVKVRL